MRKQLKKAVSSALLLSMVLGAAAVPATNAGAAKKPKLSSSKVTVSVGKTKTIKVKNTKKKVNSLAVTTNDAYRAVCRYWDRIARPEQLMSAMINAMRVLTDTAETGAVCISLPQDVEGECYDFPEEFFRKRVHRIVRIVPVKEELEDAVKVLAEAKKPLVICGGGVRYSEAGEALERFCEEFHIPFAETQSG